MNNHNVTLQPAEAVMDETKSEHATQKENAMSSQEIIDAYKAAGAPKDDDSRARLMGELLRASDFSHITSGHPVRPDSFHIYRRDAGSITGVGHPQSFPKRTPFVEVARTARTGVCVGGERGNVRH